MTPEERQALRENLINIDAFVEKVRLQKESIDDDMDKIISKCRRK